MTGDRRVAFAMPDLGVAEEEAVLEVLRSGWLTTGPRAKEFELAFLDAIGAPGAHALATNSATAALHLALAALGVGVGDTVAVPTYTFTATAEVVRYVGAEVEFVDVDEDLMMDLEALPDRVPHLKCVMPVHFGGLPFDVAKLRSMVGPDVLIVDDAAHAFPARQMGRFVGAQGANATAFSFYANKTITTGEGGMLVTGDAAMAKAARVLRLHGIDRDAFDRFTAVGSDAWRYDIVAPGFKYNMTDVAAAMGLVQLRRAEVMRQRREQIAGAYRHLLADLPLTLPREAAPGSVHAWHLFVVRVLPGSAKSRDEVGRGLASRGVGTSVHYRPLHQHSYWRDRYRLRMEDFPAANHAFDSALSLPIHSQMTDEDVQYVSDELVRLMT